MKKSTLLMLGVLSLCATSQAQLSPAITSWLQNTTETGSYYNQGNSTPIDLGILYNCQEVEYSNDFVYVHTTGVPAYPTGPFLDGNPSQAMDQEAIYKIPLSPVENTGTPVETSLGNIGVFINGVSLFDWKDGVSWNPNTNALCGGPGNDACPGGPAAIMDWNRDAVPAEMDGFDCSKAHPANGNYHHHQNPSAFKLDLDVVSTICNLYDADGLYAIDSTEHSPLIGFAYDGFPIYGAYAYENTDGTGDIVRMKTAYQKSGATTRVNGPAVDATYFDGYFKEDYSYVANTQSDYLDEHNGRFCITPEYPNGTYAYFATVDENWNSVYPYVVGPTFYGVSDERKVTSVNEETTVYDGTLSVHNTDVEKLSVSIFPNPASDLIAIQVNDLVDQNYSIKLFDSNGKLVESKVLKSGSTILYFDTQTLYSGTYFVNISSNDSSKSHKVIISK